LKKVTWFFQSIRENPNESCQSKWILLFFPSAERCQRFLFTAIIAKVLRITCWVRPQHWFSNAECSNIEWHSASNPWVSPGISIRSLLVISHQLHIQPPVPTLSWLHVGCFLEACKKSDLVLA
jgi:hypothetical protein